MVLTWFSRAAIRLGRRPHDTPPTAAATADPAALTKLDAAETHYNANRIDEAASILRPLLASGLRDARLFRIMGAIQNISGSYETALSLLDESLNLEPKHPLALQHLAIAWHGLGNPQQAAKSITEAIAVSPDTAQLRNIAGVILMNAGDFRAALENFHRALELDPSDPSPWEKIALLRSRAMGSIPFDESVQMSHRRRQAYGRLLQRLRSGRLDAAEANALIAMSLGSRERFPTAMRVSRGIASTMPETASWRASTFAMAGELEPFRELHETALASNPASREASAGLGIALILEAGARWLEGWHRTIEFSHQIHAGAYVSSVPEWEGQEIKDARLLIYQEQGVGDALLALRLLQVAAQRCRNIVLWMDPRVSDLAQFAPGYVELDRSPSRPDPLALGCTYAAPLMSLIRILAIGPSEIPSPPVLKGPPERAAKWSSYLAGAARPRIGIAATGNPGRSDDWLRSVSPTDLGPISRLKSICWVNLAVDPRPDRDRAIEVLGMLDPTADICDFADSAALVAELDAVVSIDSVVGHLSASLGKPSWILLPTMLDWRWSVKNGQVAWWPTATLIKSEAPGVWSAAVRRLATELAECFPSARN